MNLLQKAREKLKRRVCDLEDDLKRSRDDLDAEKKKTSPHAEDEVAYPHTSSLVLTSDVQFLPLGHHKSLDIQQSSLHFQSSFSRPRYVCLQNFTSFAYFCLSMVNIQSKMARRATIIHNKVYEMEPLFIHTFVPCIKLHGKSYFHYYRMFCKNMVPKFGNTT